MSLFKKLKERNLPLSFTINKVQMPHPAAEGD